MLYLHQSVLDITTCIKKYRLRVCGIGFVEVRKGQIQKSQLKNKTNLPTSSNSHPSATANKAIHSLKIEGGTKQKNQREHHFDKVYEAVHPTVFSKNNSSSGMLIIWVNPNPSVWRASTLSVFEIDRNCTSVGLLHHPFWLPVVFRHFWGINFQKKN